MGTRGWRSPAGGRAHARKSAARAGWAASSSQPGHVDDARQDLVSLAGPLVGERERAHVGVRRRAAAA